MKLPSCYIHIPFCIRKCRYCSFFSIEKTGCDIPSYIQALLNEEIHEDKTQYSSIYIGGGTPTCLSPAELAVLLEGIERIADINTTEEYTIEGNPGTLDNEKLEILLEYGVNRISIGCQSFNNSILTFLGRIHSAEESRQAVDRAHDKGFSNISVDIMYGIPGQTADEVKHDILEACKLKPEHISCYQLSAELETPLYKDIKKGKYSLPDEEMVCRMDITICGILEKNNYERYEISNFAQKGYESLHNIHYWQGGEYAGFGAGAVSRLGRQREKRVEDIDLYMASGKDSPERLEYSENVSGSLKERELLMTGLRMIRGISNAHFLEHTGNSLSKYKHTFERLDRGGYVKYSEEHVKLTQKGLPVLNEILVELF
ncbi:radical SAM family heme chaperone HemW [Planctomycetota bacterium]